MYRVMAKHLKSKKQQLDIDDIFFLADDDEDGYLDYDELRKAMEAIGHRNKSRDLGDLLDEFSHERDGHVNQTQFRAMVMYRFAQRCGIHSNLVALKNLFKSYQSKNSDDPERNGDVFTLFKMFDHDRKGHVSKQKLREGFKKLTGSELSDDDLDVMMEQADENGDGKIDIYDFERVLNTNYFPDDN